MTVDDETLVQLVNQEFERHGRTTMYMSVLVANVAQKIGLSSEHNESLRNRMYNLPGLFYLPNSDRLSTKG